MKLAAPIALLALLAALMAGCGSAGDSSSSDGTSGASTPHIAAPAGAAAESCETEAVDAEGLRATGLGCEQARRLLFAWQRDPGCAPASGASRSACSIGAYRCLAVVTARGVSASCARPGRSVAFIARRG